MRLGRIFSAILLIGATALLSGCIYKGGSNAVGAIDLPHRGEPIPEESWKVAEGDQLRGGSSQFIWAIPITMAGHNWSFDPEATQARFESMRWYDIGPIVITLPIYISSQTREYTREGGSIRESGITWHPFWASAQHHGPEGEAPTRFASGIPLLWSRVRLENKQLASDMRIATHLWSLGPVLVRLKVAPPVEEGEKREEGNMYLFAPMALGGGPGLLLWTSYRMQSPGGFVTGHGPIVGQLGYAGSRSKMRMTEETEEYEAVRTAHRLVAGFLWYSTSLKRDDGKTKTARNGPLFGIFGWGRTNYAPAIQFLWFKIPVGKGDPARANTAAKSDPA